MARLADHWRTTTFRLSLLYCGVFVLVVTPSVPVQSVQELVAYARANPGKINFGFGQGTLPHILGASLKASSGVDISSIPYKGGAQAVADMLGGHIQMNFGTTATLLPLIRQGKLRALAVTGDARAPSPGTQDFWVASSTGSGPRTLEWDPTDGSWTVVVMNADGRAGIDVALELWSAAGQ